MGEVYKAGSSFSKILILKSTGRKSAFISTTPTGRATGISTQEIGRTLQLALSGRRYGYFIYNDRQYEVIRTVGQTGTFSTRRTALVIPEIRDW
jgi:multidrug efflux pump